MTQTNFLSLLKQREALLDEIERVSNQIDRDDDRGRDTFHLHQELTHLRKQLDQLQI